MPWPGVAWLLAYTKVPRFARDDKGDISDRADIRRGRDPEFGIRIESIWFEWAMGTMGLNVRR
jgi:hypothetical protein